LQVAAGLLLVGLLFRVGTHPTAAISAPLEKARIHRESGEHRIDHYQRHNGRAMDQ